MPGFLNRAKTWITVPAHAAGAINLSSDAALFFLKDIPSVEAALTFWAVEIVQMTPFGGTAWGYSLVNAGFAVGMGFLRHSIGIMGNPVADHTVPILMGVWGTAAVLYAPLVKGGEFLQQRGPELARKFRSSATETTSCFKRSASTFAANILENGGTWLCKGATYIKPVVGVLGIGLHIAASGSLTWQGLHGDPKRLIVAGVKTGWIGGDFLYNEMWKLIRPSCSVMRHGVKRALHGPPLVILKLH